MGNSTVDALLVSRLAELSERLCTPQNLSDVLGELVHGAAELVGCAQASAMLFAAPTHRLIHKSVWGFTSLDQPEARLELTDDVAKWLYEGGQLLALADEQGPRFLVVVDPEDRLQCWCELRLPFFVGDQLIGVLSVGPKVDGTDYRTEEFDALRVLLSLGAICLEGCYLRQRPPEDACTVAAARPRPGQRWVRLSGRQSDDELLGRSVAMQQVKELIQEVAPRDVPVLITGESGTGKELVAKAIHRLSSRGQRPMVTVNCAALQDALVESELFGHERGAYTGAFSRRIGKFEFAHGSTLFLDEIGDMSAVVQAKVLRVIEQGTLQRLGSNDTVEVDVRLLAATNRDLGQEVAAGRFREDLYYRLNVVEIHLPPLRERPEDIPLLAEHFFRRFAALYGKELKGIDPRALKRLMHYDFPGNVRELRHIIERAVLLERGSHLTFRLVPFSQAEGKALAAADGGLTLEELERRYLEKVLREAGYNKSQAARVLGIARKTLREKMRKYGLCAH